MVGVVKLRPRKHDKISCCPGGCGWLSAWCWFLCDVAGFLFCLVYYMQIALKKSFFVQVLLIGKSINFLHQVCHDQTPSTKMIAVAKSTESSKDGRVSVFVNFFPLN